VNRYLVLTELFLPTKGGTAIWAAEVYRRLGGKDTHIITSRVPGSDEIDLNHPNTIHRLNLRRVSWLRPESVVMYLKLLGAGLWLGISCNFTAVHAIRALPEGLVAWIVARLTGRPLVIYAHGEELTGWGRGGKYRVMLFTLRRADVLIANSEFTRRQLLDMRMQAERIRVVYPGVDVNRFRPDLPSADLRARLRLNSRQKLLLSVGRLQRRKGFDQVIRALPMLLSHGHDVHYALIGIGDDETYLRTLIGELSLADRVHMLGHVPEIELPRWYSACDVFVMPNREIEGDTEGFGIVYIEAAACGKPALAGQGGGTGSAVLDGITGLRVNGDDLEEISAALCRLLGDDDLRQRLGFAGFARAERDFAWEKVAEDTLRL